MSMTFEKKLIIIKKMMKANKRILCHQTFSRFLKIFLHKIVNLKTDHSQ